MTAGIGWTDAGRESGAPEDTACRLDGARTWPPSLQLPALTPPRKHQVGNFRLTTSTSLLFLIHIVLASVLPVSLTLFVDNHLPVLWPIPTMITSPFAPSL